ncbi:hydrocephalus-inducing protein homolog [Hyla sarda]|uniref:hydrocephalus-inducing protein homolog n=1 Tax=Hyla sarda TaxID=327740 RepID=UPI0024C2D2D5|nr:hydrocephalus-inducing protein homolog [Hyla sarda]
MNRNINPHWFEVEDVTKGIEEEIKWFWATNKGSADIFMVWDAMKAYLRGILSRNITQFRRKVRKKEDDLVDQIKKLEEVYATDARDENWGKLEQAQKEYKELMLEKAQHRIFFWGQKRYAEGGKSNKWLSGIIKNQRENTEITNLENKLGLIVTDQEEIRKIAMEYYQTLYESEGVKSESEIKTFLQNLVQPSLNEEGKRKMNEGISLGEVQEALRTCAGNSVPGSDGFSFDFYKRFHGSLLPCLLEIINESLERGAMTPSMSEAVIILIPKKGGNREKMENYGPISLLNTDYKIFAKLWAGRLKKVLGMKINWQKSGLMPLDEEIEVPIGPVKVLRLNDSLEYLGVKISSAVLDFERLNLVPLLGKKLLNFCSDVLSPGDKMEVPITFYPRAAILYQETVVFKMNGHFTQLVQLQGHGIEMKIEVADPKYKVINFGAVNIGQTVKRVIPIVNKSLSPVTCSLHFSPSVPALQEPKVLSLSPNCEITLSAHNGLCKLEMQFTPRSRIAPFAEEVMLGCYGMMHSLFVVQGCSQGLELNLDQEYMSFGAVVLHSQATRRVVLSNTGELGIRFEWDIKRFEPDFSIWPTSGYITAGTEVTFDVVFHPTEINSDIHYEDLLCFIEGGKTLKLTLSGSCIGLPSTKEVVNFQCQVRTKQTQTITLSNKTNQTWHLQPVIDGEHWSGVEFIIVEAQQNKPYEITYHPLIMSLKGRKHQGSIFFPMPDGTGLLYLLHGQAEPPKSSGNVIREVPCKTSYTELLTVSNWLHKTQRFRAIIEILKPERLDSATTIKGLDYVEVPGGAKRDYKLNFHSHKEGNFSTKVTFRNETTQEYMFYYITFKSTPPGIISTIELVTLVRQSTAATLRVENPLSVPVTFTTDCKVPEINLPPQITVPAQSEVT